MMTWNHGPMTVLSPDEEWFEPLERGSHPTASICPGLLKGIKMSSQQYIAICNSYQHQQQQHHQHCQQ